MLNGRRLSLFFRLPSSFSVLGWWLLGKSGSVPSYPGAAVSGAGRLALPERVSLRKPLLKQSRAVRGFLQSTGTTGRVCPEDGCLEHYVFAAISFQSSLRAFAVVSVASVSDHGERRRLFSAPGRWSLTPTWCQYSGRDPVVSEGYISNLLPSYAEFSSLFLPLLQITTKLRIRGNSSLMFILLLSTICVENVHNPLLSLFRQF